MRQDTPVGWYREERKQAKELGRAEWVGSGRQALRKERCFSAGGRPKQSFASGWPGSSCVGQMVCRRGRRRGLQEALPPGHTH